MTTIFLSACNYIYSRWPRILWFLVIWITFFLASPFFVSRYDEGIILTGAFRVLAGELPSVDFYTNYGPGQFYLVASAMKLFGNSVDVGRIYHSLTLTLILTASFNLMLFMGHRRYASAPLGLIFALLLLYNIPLYPPIQCTFLMLIGCFLIIKAIDSAESFRDFIPVALIIVTITVIRYDLGLIALAAFAIPVFLVEPQRGVDSEITYKSRFFRTLVYSTVTGAFLLAALGLLFLVGILRPALQDILTYNAGNYAAMRSLPFPGLATLIRYPVDTAAVYLPLFAVAFGVLVCATYYFPSRKTHDRSYLSIVTMTAVTFCFFFKALVRVHPFHALISDVPAVILTFFCMAHLAKQCDIQFGAITKKVAYLLSLGVASSCIIITLIHRGNSSLYHHLDAKILGPDIPALGHFSTNPSQTAAIRYVIESTKAEDRILSATGRHDKIFANDVSLYFIAQRLPGTRWHHYDPGVQNNLDVQLEMIRELEQNRVDVIIRDSTWDHIIEPNKSAESSGITTLDDYISLNYSIVKEFGSVTVHKR